MARQLGLRRFIAAAMSLVVVLAAVVGLASHTTAHGHHGNISATPVHLEADVATDHGQQSVADHGHDKSTPCTHDGAHSHCGDFICHGGWTIAEIRAVVVSLIAEPMQFGWHDDAMTSDVGVSLDRPPKSPVRA